MGNGSEHAWDDDHWRESADTAWAAGCRWLQSWWRAHVLELPPGPLGEAGTRVVSSMLPIGEATANFLTPAVVKAATDRLAEGSHSGLINEDRLFRNLLSSQPTCFNLFGEFVDDPDALLGWVRTIDSNASTVSAVRFEWAPQRDLHFGGGSAFDLFVTYRSADEQRPRFIGVEVKYAENLSRSSITVREPYREFTRSSGLWQPGAADRLDAARTKQFWLNTLLGQSLVTRSSDHEDGTVVVMAAAADLSARQATDAVRAELVDPDAWLRWSPYEELLDAVTGHDDWKEAFRRRYLDFTRVRHLLSADDPRR